MTSALNDALVSTWVTGWSRCRDYEVRHDGPVHASLRTGHQSTEGQDWEYVIANPDQDALAAASVEVQGHPGRLLTVVGTAPAIPEGVPLKRVSTGEKLMVVDMTGQDVEAPIVPEEFEAAIERAQPLWDNPIVTEVSELPTFHTAEEYHQDFYAKHPEQGYCRVIIDPKLAKARKYYAQWLAA